MTYKKSSLAPLAEFLHKIATFVVAILLLLMAGCSEAELPRGKYRVIDSGIWVSENEPFIWLDNQRLIFITSESLRSDVTRPARAIWSLRSPATIDRKFVESLWCYDDGVLGFRQKIDSDRSWFKGEIGQEKPWKFSSCRLSKKAFRRPLLWGGTCECLDDVGGPWLTRNISLLKDGHGWLDLGSDRGSAQDLANLPVIYHRRQGSDVPMPFRSREIGVITFHSFKGAYFIEGIYFNSTKNINESPWPKAFPEKVWWLFPDGQVIEVVIPVVVAQKLKRAYWVRFIPTQRGIAATTKGGWVSNSNAGEDGVYLINGDAVEEILDGNVEDAGVSPDGCRLAVSSAVNNDANRHRQGNKEFRTLKVIELCNSPEDK